MKTQDDTLTTNHEHCIDVCNSLLRGELAAVETYGQAIGKHSGARVTEELRRIRADHSRSANMLSANVREMGGEPDKDSGAWGLFATAVQAAANLFGADSAIDALRKGEVACRSDYQEALLDDDVMADCKLMIREELLPPVIEHIATLDKLEHVG